MIYDHLRKARPANTDPSDRSAIQASVEVTTPHIRLVSRQIKEEAEAQVRKNITLSLRDYAGCNLSKPPLILVATDTTSHTEFAPMAFCSTEDECLSGIACHAAIDILEHVSWVQKLPTLLLSLKTLHVELFVEWDLEQHHWPSSPHGSKLLEALDTFVKMPHLTSLKVRKDTSRDCGVPAKYGREKHDL